MIETDELIGLAQNFRQRIDELPEQYRSRVEAAGIFFYLIQDGSSRAIRELYEFARTAETEETRNLADSALGRLARDNSEALDAILLLLLERENTSLLSFVKNNQNIGMSTPSLSLFKILYGPTPAYDISQNQLDQLENYIISLPLTIQKAYLQRLEKKIVPFWSDWAKILKLYIDFAASELIGLEQKFNHLTPVLQKYFIDILAKLYLVKSIPDAKEMLLQIYFDADFLFAKETALSLGFLPDPIEKRALFLFLTDQWKEYEALDFDKRLIQSAFLQASAGLKNRVLAHSRTSGQLEWLNTIQVSHTTRNIIDLTDADWEKVIGELFNSQRYSELFRLAQSGPIWWSVQIINRLEERHIQPPDAIWNVLIALAAKCENISFLPHIHQKISVQPFQVYSLALDHSQKLLSAGASQSAIPIWNFPSLTPRINLTTSSAFTRSLVFGVDQELLVAAGNDHKIRLIRLDDNKIIKILEGHSGMIRSLVIHPSNRYLTSASFDGRITLWRFPEGTEINHLDTNTEIFSMAGDHEGKFIISTGADCKISIWNSQTLDLVRQIEVGNFPATYLAISPTSNLLCCGAKDLEMNIYNYSSGKWINAWQMVSNQRVPPSFYSEEQLLFVCNPQSHITLSNYQTRNQILSIPLPDEQAVSLLYAPFAEKLLYGSEKGNIIIWDFSIFNLIRKPIRSLENDEKFVQRLQEIKNVTPSEQNWLNFIEEMLKFIHRYDIELSEQACIDVGEFDIEI